jgi:hypothetical protein
MHSPAFCTGSRYATYPGLSEEMETLFSCIHIVLSSRLVSVGVTWNASHPEAKQDPARLERQKRCDHSMPISQPATGKTKHIARVWVLHDNCNQNGIETLIQLILQASLRHWHYQKTLSTSRHGTLQQFMLRHHVPSYTRSLHHIRKRQVLLHIHRRQPSPALGSGQYYRFL